MLELLSSHRKILFWLTLHILLGFVSVYTNLVLIAWYYFITISVLYSLFVLPARKGAATIVLYLIYTGGFELLGRMSRCSPYIPYEIGKYSFLVFSVLGILLSFKVSSKSVLGIVILLLIIPSFFVDVSNRVNVLDVVFNVIGLINVALGIILFSSMQISFVSLIKCMRLLILPIISILAYAYIRTPDLSEIEFDLASSTLATGGFGSNQVSTVFGLGFMIMAITWIGNVKLFKYRWLDGIISMIFLIQALLTFSRGGVIGGLIGIAAFSYYMNKIEQRERSILKIPNVKLMVLPAIVLIAVGFVWVDNLTQGTLAMRYKGETIGTLKGLREKDINTVTSGRVGLLEADMLLWKENPLLGVGIGASRYERVRYKGIAPHTELTRILAEHGLAGLVVIFIIIYIVRSIFKSRLANYIKGYIVALLFLAVFSSFHSATRTFVTPLLFSISCMSVMADFGFKQRVSQGLIK